ncbi:MAG TPA: 3-hydroxyacyl-CoA dehydrogenase NAD-binding domain-containing protein [Gaiellaceae bacterium]|nr:3-hydroxyacyl-CoA dehydrogenase NAD-binding domain-containing protein [Gaiellaceae bacterium]
MKGETEFFVQPVETRVGRIALVTIDNGEDWTKPSTFGRAAFESAWRALERLESEPWAGMVLTGKPFVFAAGADIREFPKTAVKFVVVNAMRQNRMLTGAEAFELGFADALLAPVEFLDESLEHLVRHIEAGAPAREPADLSDTEEVIRKARLQLEEQLHGAAPAPVRALDLIEGAARWTIEEGYRAEEDALADLLPGPQAQASVYAFDLVERRAKKGVGIPEVEPRRIEKVGIVGAGLMARQLATLFLKRLEVPVVLRDLEQSIVDEAVAEVAEGQRKEHLRRLVSGSTDYEIFAGCDLILEAVYEELSVKQEVIAELRRVAPEAIVATNTSSLSVAEMGADVGLHFFNPVAVLPLVEIVATPSTDDVTLATAWDVVKRLKKRGVLVQDAPAFVVNRVLTRMTTVLMDALEHGNTVEETDEAILRLGLPMAPSVLLQMVGPRVANHVLHTLHEAYPDRFPLSPTLDSFAGGRDEIVSRGDNRRTVDEIQEAALEAVADEIRHLLDEGVVAEAADVDTCLILGAGYPFFLGGITKHLDQRGISKRLFGARFDAAPAPAPA